MEYELLYLVGESRDGELPKIREDVEAIVGEFGGAFLPAETEEKRNLAYLIKKDRRGTFIARRFTLPAASDEPFAEAGETKEGAIEGINRKLLLYPAVLRFLILRAEKLPELKPIPREERPARRDDRRRAPSSDRRSYESRPIAPKPVVAAPIADVPAEPKSVATEAVAEVEPKPVEKPSEKPAEKRMSAEELDKQLKEMLDI